MRMVLAAVLALLVSCGDDDTAKGPVSAAERELVALSKRVSVLENELLDVRKQLIRDRDEREQLRRRVVSIESLFADRLSEQASALSQSQPAQEPEKRGGFADFSQSKPIAASAIPIPSRPPPASSRGPQVVIVGDGSGETDATIKRHCEAEWGSNFRMRAYCEKEQREAKERLSGRSASTSGVPPLDFEAIRRGCRDEWPGNYRMQDYCEKEQVEAWRKVHR